MRDFITRLYPLQAYPDPIARFRAAATYVTSTATLLATLFTLVVFGSRFAAPADSTDQFYNFAFIITLVLTVTALLTLLATRYGRRDIGALLIILSWVIPAWAIIATTEMATANFWLGFALLMVGISLSALLIGPRMVVYVTAASIVVLGISALNRKPEAVNDLAINLVL